MGTKIIRGISEEDMQAIAVRAAEVGMSSEAWLRDQIHWLVTHPQTKQRYSFTIIGPGKTNGTLERNPDRLPNAVVLGSLNNETGQAQAEAYRAAMEYMRRNEPGDRERALTTLREQFQQVEEK